MSKGFTSSSSHNKPKTNQNQSKSKSNQIINRFKKIIEKHAPQFAVEHTHFRKKKSALYCASQIYVNVLAHKLQIINPLVLMIMIVPI